MDAKLAAEMALRAARLHRSREKAIHASLSWWGRCLLKLAWRTPVARLLMDAGATRALNKYGNAVGLRYDISHSPTLAPLQRFLG